ncbi:MAG: DegT/DnrJ/EryC1/StrS family aminotransferase [Candidatus Omnitrophica bacterium]|nr:DegT/DnrJ/EryC1/StrS family aminotransferase [Candidatus Omnitrophota bacterium]
MIPHSRPTLENVNLHTWGEMLESGHLARGVFCERLETLFIEKILGTTPDSFRARSVQSGTQALHVGLWALKLLREKDGDTSETLEVIAPTLACGALVQAIRAVGAKPVLCDTTMDGNLDINQAVSAITPKTLAILVPHLYGKPIDLGPLLQTGVPIFEDCAQTLGVETDQGRVGTMGRLMMSSFYATKPICTGQGGIVATADVDLMDEIEGLCRYDGRDDSGPGWNANLSDWSAALAIPQIEHFDQSLARRKAIAEFYSESLGDLSDRIVLPEATALDAHAWYRYVVLVPNDSSQWSERLHSLGVEAKRPVFLPQHKIFDLPGHFPLAEDQWKRSLSLPIYPSLSDEERNEVVSAVRAVATELN